MNDPKDKKEETSKKRFYPDDVFELVTRELTGPDGKMFFGKVRERVEMVLIPMGDKIVCVRADSLADDSTFDSDSFETSMRPGPFGNGRRRDWSRER